MVKKGMTKNKLTREIAKAKEAQRRIISQGEEFISVEALKQIIYSAQTPENFNERFTAGVNVFNVLIFKDKPFEEIPQATDTKDAIRAFHYGVNNFYSRLKDQNISSEELVEMMKFAISMDKKNVEDNKKDEKNISDKNVGDELNGVE